MKKTSLKAKMAFIGASLAFILPMAGCSSDEPALTPSEPLSVKSDIRSVEDACNIAIAFLSADSDAPQSRSISDIENVKVGYSNNSRNSADILFYSVNLSDDGGFVLVSAPKAAEPVLAYVEAGSYDPAENSDNPGFNLFIEKSKEYTMYASDFEIVFSGDGDIVPIEKPYTIVREAKPKLQVEWGQSYPEGLYCSNGLSGCVQTAMAQIFSYFEQPTSIELTYPGHDIERVELNWSEIKKHRTSCKDDFFSLREHLGNCEATEESHKALAYLCRELGYRNNAKYLTWEKDGILGTSAFSQDANSLYKKLLPSRKVTAFSLFGSSCFDNLILTMKSEKAVAHFRGSDASGGGGHAWVCEGGRHYEYHTKAILLNGKEDVRNTYYFYFNWGSNGDYNGYFLGNVYDTSQGIQENEIPAPKNPRYPLSKSRSNYSKDVYYYMIY